MIELTLKNKKYLMPGSMKELTVANFLTLSDGKKDVLEMLSELAGIPLEDLRSSPKKVVDNILFTFNQIAELYGDTSFLKEENVEAPEYFMHEGDKYLVPEDIGELTSGQWFDCNAMMSKYQDNQFKFYTYLIAIYCQKAVKGSFPFYREKAEAYNCDAVEERANSFLNMKMLDAHKINVFFLMINNEYAKDFLTCFQPAMNQLVPSSKQS